MHDLKIIPHDDDFTFTLTVISHLEHTDDILLICGSWTGLQAHLDFLAAWCKHNFLYVNAGKSWIMVFGRPKNIPNPLPLLTLDGKQVPYTVEHTYMGIMINSTELNMFAQHLQEYDKCCPPYWQCPVLNQTHYRQSPTNRGSYVVQCANQPVLYKWCWCDPWYLPSPSWGHVLSSTELTSTATECQCTVNDCPAVHQAWTASSSLPLSHNGTASPTQFTQLTGIWTGKANTGCLC